MKNTLRDALAAATRNIDAIDARVLLRTLLRVDDVYLIAHAERALTEAETRQYHALVERRAGGEPVAYIVGEREFYGRAFVVTPAVLIPRPETELLVELVLQRLSFDAVVGVLDLGTGSGCIALSVAAERAAARVTATDMSMDALNVARRNAQRLGISRVAFVQGRWFEALDTAQRFDLILANPPYVRAGDAHLTLGDLRFEPAGALSSGADGLDDIRAIVAGARAHLVPAGWLLFEHGYDQAATCRELLEQAGYSQVQSWRDLAGIERVSGARAPL